MFPPREIPSDFQRQRTEEHQAVECLSVGRIPCVAVINGLGGA